MSRISEHENWYKMDPETRQGIVDVIVVFLGVDERQAEELKVARDEDPFWHFGLGMSVRNALRKTGFTDDMLPPVKYPDGGSYSNWDDYYVSALEAACGIIPV